MRDERNFQCDQWTTDRYAGPNRRGAIIFHKEIILKMKTWMLFMLDGMILLLLLIHHCLHANATIQWAQQSTIHMATFGSSQFTPLISVTHLSICTSITPTNRSRLFCKKIILHPLHVSIDPIYISIVTSNQATHISSEDQTYLQSLSLASSSTTCPHQQQHHVSIWLLTERRSINYVNRCFFGEGEEEDDHNSNTSLSSSSSSSSKIEAARPLHVLQDPSQDVIAPSSLLNPIITPTNSQMPTPPPPPPPSTPDQPTERKTSETKLFGVKNIQSKSVRAVWMSFIETNMKISDMASAGVHTKELYAMVVDNIGKKFFFFFFI